MKVLIDTNILLDVILLREPHFELSKRVLQCCQSIVDGYIAVHTFSNMFYVLHETEDFSIEDCRNTFNKLLYVFDVASLDKSDVIAAINNESFDDLEDSMQHQSSIVLLGIQKRRDIAWTDIPASATLCLTDLCTAS